MHVSRQIDKVYEQFLMLRDSFLDFLSILWLRQKECLTLDEVFAAEAVISVFMSYKFDLLEPRDLFFAVTVALKHFQSV